MSDNPMFGETRLAMKRAAEFMTKAHQEMVEANTHMLAAHEHITKTTTAFGEAIDALGRANEEQEDLRETVRRLETLVMEQTRKIQELSDRLNGGDKL